MSRIEGHASIKLITENGKFKDVKVEVEEGPRLFERMVINKHYNEVTRITPRICAICSVSHRLACIKAVEKALKVKVTEKTKLLRYLLHYGEMLESHYLHIYYLALPDYLGFPSVVPMVEKFREEVMRAVNLHKFGNRIMEIVSLRRIHGDNPIVGGFGKYPSKEELLEIKETAEKLLDDAIKTVELFGSLSYFDEATSEEENIWMCTYDPEGYIFEGDIIKISIGEEKRVEEYRSLTNERVVSHSTAKRCSYKGRSFGVGSSARVINNLNQLSPKAKEFAEKYGINKYKRNPLYMNLTQAIECLHCIENIPGLIDKILDLPSEEERVVEPEVSSGHGISAVEAPRGTLYYEYKIENNFVVEANLVIPTTQNLDNMEYYCKLTAQRMLPKKKEEEVIKYLEMIVRAYDPCISCSVHLVKL